VKKSAKKAAAPGGRPAKQPGAKHGSGRAGTTFDTGEQLLPWADRWQNADAATDPLETTGPFPIAIPPEPPTGEQSRFVIVAVSAVVVLVLLIAMFSVRDLFSGDDEGSRGPSTTGTQPPTATGGPSVAPTTPGPQVTTLSPTAVSPRVAAIRALDPEGDGDEDTRRSPRAVDGDPSTTWRSQSYNSAAFGGLKDGVGLSLKLEAPAVLRAVQLDVKRTGGTVEIRVGDTPDISASTVVATQDLTSEQLTITATGAKPAEYVMLWFTSLPRDGGKYRIEVSEVRLT